ncbi:MAG: DUF2911 domain-containing protein [Gemmatimonadaceae bacterium]
MHNPYLGALAHVTRGIFAALLSSSAVHAQIRPSEHGTVSQQVATTTITVEYDRPGARGRMLFGDGKVVHWGEVWTPGANWATTMDVDKNVRVDGHPLPKGKYSVWLIPQAAPAPWTLLFARTARLFHTRPPSAGDEQLRVPVRPEQSIHMETLAWYFPVVTPDGATLRLHWGTTVVPVQIGVDMARPGPLLSERRTPYVGTYRMRVTPSTGRSPYDVDLVVADENGAMKLKTLPASAFGDGELDLVPISDGKFHLLSAQLPKLEGQFYGAPGLLLVFDLVGGRARSVEMIAYDGRVVGRGQLAK